MLKRRSNPCLTSLAYPAGGVPCKLYEYYMWPIWSRQRGLSGHASTNHLVSAKEGCLVVSFQFWSLTVSLVYNFVSNFSNPLEFSPYITCLRSLLCVHVESYKRICVHASYCCMTGQIMDTRQPIHPNSNYRISAVIWLKLDPDIRV